MSKHLLAALAVLFCCGGKAWACDCGRRDPTPCRGLSATDSIFVGTVLRIDTQVSEEDGNAGSGATRFRIDEKLSGTTGPEIDVYPGQDNCGYPFAEGAKYVVSAFQGSDGRLHATACGDTGPIELSQALLSKFRAMRDNRPIPSLFGVLRNGGQPPYASSSVREPGEPLANTSVQLHSGEHVFESKTDTNGIYAFYGVPAGEYQMSAELPANTELTRGWFLDEPLEPVKLPEGACYEYNTSAQPTGRIRGRVLGPDGKPLSFADLGLFPAEKYPDAEFRWTEFQDQREHKGFFEFSHVKPGDYTLVFNDLDKIDPDTPFPRFYYPGVRELAAAQRIHLQSGQQFLDADIRVFGGHTARDITVKLVAEEGKLPNIHYVEVSGLDGSSPGEQELTLGVYTISIFTDVRYTLHGRGYCSATGTESETEPAEVEGSDFDTKEIALVFKGKGCVEPPKASQDKEL